MDKPAEKSADKRPASAPSQRVEPRRLKGFRDFLPDLMAARYAIEDVIRAEGRLAGFRLIGTPALEYAETLLGQGSEETDKQVYRFKDHGERDVALRFDLTVPFARYVAEHQSELVFPFKKLQMGDVWRGENTQKGRYREFRQCDLDIIGVDSAAADIEILAAFHKILSRIDCGGFTISIGDRLLLSAMIRQAMPAATPREETEILIALDKLAKIGQEKVTGIIAALACAQNQDLAQFFAVLTAKLPSGDSDIAAIAEYVKDDAIAQTEIARMRHVIHTVRGLVTNGDGRIRLDLTIARGLGYYTGIVFETTLNDLPGFGSISSGGRYNDLASRFSSRELPGVGGSIGLDRLLAGLEEMGKIKAAQGDLVFVAVATPDAEPYAFQVAEKLRRAGIATEIGLTPKLGNQFKHADRLKCPYVVTVGSDEQQKRTYALKDMAKGTEERDLPFNALAETLAARLAAKA